MTELSNDWRPHNGPLAGATSLFAGSEGDDDPATLMPDPEEGSGRQSTIDDESHIRIASPAELPLLAQGAGMEATTAWMDARDSGGIIGS
jgi:hypothetical protein